MLSLNKSFLWGMIFASITWIFSLYLYCQIISIETSPPSSTHFISPSDRAKLTSERHRFINNDIEEGMRKKWHSWKDRMNYQRTFMKKYHNSDQLIKSLQPVNIDNSG